MQRLLVAILTITGLLVSADAAAAAVEFTPSTLSIPANQASDIAVGDLDGKNGPDIVTALNTDGLAVSLNNGDGTFAAPVTYPTGCPVYDVELGDLGGQGGVNDNALDGILDAAIVCGPGGYLGRLAGNGTGGFGTANVVSNLWEGAFNGGSPQDLALVQLRAPGYPPVPFYTYGTGSSGNYQRLLCATYDWQQPTCGAGVNGEHPGPFLFAGTIADARLFTLGGTKGILDWGFDPEWRASTRDRAPTPPGTGTAFYSITIGDLQGDGPDLMSSAGTCGCGYQDNPPAGVITVNYGDNATGVPDQVGTTMTSAPGVINISTGDFDLDGHEDVIGTFYSYDSAAPRIDNGFFVQAGDGSGGLGSPQVFTLAHVDGGFSRAPVRVADLDRNGGPDAVAIVGGQVQVLLNKKSKSPTPPPAANPLSGITKIPKTAQLDPKGNLVLGNATNPPTSDVRLTITVPAAKGGGDVATSFAQLRGKSGGKKKAVVIGKAKIAIPAGEARDLKVQLSKKGRKLASKRKLKATVEIVAVGTDGAKGTDERKLKLVPKRKPKR